MPVLLKPAAWGAHLLMVLAVTAALLMGIWQYSVWSGDRAAAKRTLVHAAPVSLSSLMGGDSPFPGESIGQPVRFTGTWDDAGTVFVSHQRHAGRAGYWVVTPVRIGRSAIPVVRGFSTTPTAVEPTGTVAITGWLKPSQDEGVPDTNTRDRVITSMRIPSMTQHVDVDLYSAYVVAHRMTPATTATEGLAALGPTQQPDVSGFTGLRNLLYASQWWIFIVFILYIWWRWCQDQLHPPVPEDATGTGGSAAADQGAPTVHEPST